MRTRFEQNDILCASAITLGSEDLKDFPSIREEIEEESKHENQLRLLENLKNQT